MAVWVGLMCASSLAAASKNLEIYWIDADGGASTLIVSPSGESMLVDSGNRTPDDRDAKRIFAAAQQAGLKKIDILLTTHFHSDHMGGMAALAKLIPIEMYMDHGESVEIARPDVAAAYKAYEELSAGKRRILKAGDRIPLKGVDIDVIMSAGAAIYQTSKGRGRAECGVRRFQAARRGTKIPITIRASVSCCSSANSVSSIWAILRGTPSRNWCAR